MELRHLHYFKALAEELHFGNAAKRLFISQPPLSRQIKDLEDELQVQLFDRNHKKVSLTNAGKYFYQQIDRLIQELELVKNTTRLMQEEVLGELRIGYISSTPKDLIADMLFALKTTFPKLKVNLMELSSQRQVQALLNGQLDLCIIREGYQEVGIYKQRLYSDELCIVAPKGSSSVIADFQDTDYISFNSKYASNYVQLSMDLCRSLGLEPQIRHLCNNMNAILELVKLGVGYAVAPMSAVSQLDLLILRNDHAKDKFATTVYLAYHETNSLSGLKQVVDLIFDFVKAKSSIVKSSS